MRLAFVTPYYIPHFRFGGPPKKIHALARGIIQRGAAVRVLSFDHGKRHSDEAYEIDGVTVQYLPWMGRGLQQFPRARSLLEEVIQDADLVHCYGLYTPLGSIASHVARRLGKPVVQEPLGMFPPRGRNRLLKRLYNLAFTRPILRRAEAVIAASASEKTDLERIVHPDRIVVRPNGINVEDFSNPPKGGFLRERWNIGANDRLVLFMGRLSPIKNLEQLISAFAKAGVPEAKLVLVGPGEPDYESRLRKHVTRDGLSERVVFAGPLYGEEQRAAFSAADLLVLPSLNESFGNVAGEGVAAGVPVLLTETCGIASLIHGRAGLAVPLGVDSLAHGLRQMLNPEVCRQMTARREEVKRELSWDDPIKQTIQLYERILNKRSSVDDMPASV